MVSRMQKYFGSSDVAHTARTRRRSWGFALLVVIAVYSLSGNLSAAEEDLRELSSLAFPKHKVTSDVGDILSDYPDYLQFVLEIGDASDATLARKLRDTYQALRKRHPVGAAKFLKGLRFEMVQKLELMGANPKSMTTQNPDIRRWVTRWMKAWHREADEYLFRAIAMKAR